MGVGGGGEGKADPVVGHREAQLPVALPEPDGDLGAAGVPGDRRVEIAVSLIALPLLLDALPSWDQLGPVSCSPP